MQVDHHFVILKYETSHIKFPTQDRKMFNEVIRPSRYHSLTQRNQNIKQITN